jgi:Lrp/AsnC family leucine-responsive transcriptional regulator
MTELDAFDRRILDAVAREGRISIAALATRVGLSKSPRPGAAAAARGARRDPRLAAILDPRAMGREHVAFVEVKLSDTARRRFRSSTRRRPCPRSRPAT